MKNIPASSLGLLTTNACLSLSPLCIQEEQDVTLHKYYKYYVPVFSWDTLMYCICLCVFHQSCEISSLSPELQLQDWIWKHVWHVKNLTGWGFSFWVGGQDETFYTQL